MLKDSIYFIVLKSVGEPLRSVVKRSAILVEIVFAVGATSIELKLTFNEVISSN